MVAAARSGSADGLGIAAKCILALAGITHPTPEQTAGAILEAHHHNDLRVLALGKNLKE